MPELGKATYILELQSGATFTRPLASVEAQATSATNKIAGGFLRADKAMMVFGKTSVSTARRANAAHASMAAGATRVANAEARAAAKTETAWARASASIKKHGAIGGQAGQLLGFGAAYFAVKGGIDWLKESNAGWAQLSNSIRVTGGVAGVTAKHASDLADKYEKMTGATRGATLQTESLLLRFKNIRNVGPGIKSVFDRSMAAIEDISAATGRNIDAVTAQVGKAIQDPTKYLGLLGRAGITFTKVQQDMVKKIAATQGTLAAQEYVLKQLEGRYKGAAVASGKTFAGQMKIAKAQIDASSAAILHSLIPAFTQLVGIVRRISGVMGHHREILKNLIIGFVVFKGALYAARTAIIAVETATKVVTGLQRLYNRSLRAQGPAAATGAAETKLAMAGSAAATEGATTKVTALRAALLGVSGMVVPITVVVSIIGGTLLLEKLMGWSARGISLSAGRFSNTTGADPTARPGDPKGDNSQWTDAQWNQYFKNHHLTRKGQTFKNGMWQTASGKGSKGSKWAKPPPKVIGGPAVKPGKLTPSLADAISLAVTQPEQEAALRNAIVYEQAQLGKYKKGTKAYSAVAKALGSFQRTEASNLKSDASAAASAANKAAAAAFKKLVTLPDKYKNMLSASAITGGLADDKRALGATVSYLKGLVNNRKIAGAAHTKLAATLAVYSHRLTHILSTEKSDAASIAMSKAQLGGPGKVSQLNTSREKAELKLNLSLEASVKRQISAKGVSQHKLAALYKKWVSLDKTIASLKTRIFGQFGTGWNALVIEQAKAGRTKTMKDDLQALEDQKKYLEKQLRGQQDNVALQQKLTAVVVKETELRKKMNLAQRDYWKQVLAGGMARGSFFAQFAPSVFSGGDLGLVPGAGGYRPASTVQPTGAAASPVTGMKGAKAAHPFQWPTGHRPSPQVSKNVQFEYNQNNTFHEIPKDKHKLSKQMRTATEAALSFGG